MAKGGGGPKLRARIGIDGEQEYKAALSSIAQRMASLKSEMSVTSAEMKAQGETVGNLRQRYEELAVQYDLQREKTGTLSEMLDKCREKYGENADETRNLEKALNAALAEQIATEGQLDAVSGKLDEMEVSLGDVAGALRDKLVEGLKSAAGALGAGFLAALQGAWNGLKQIAQWAGQAAEKGYELAKSAGAMADNVLTQSQQTGIAADQLQKWTFASNFMDTSVDTITGSMARMVRAMGDAGSGSDSAKEKFAALGVSITDSNGNLRDSEDVFADCITALGGITNEAQRDAIAMDLFGKSAQDLNPLILAGGDAVKALGEEAQKLGTVFSDKQLATLGGFDDSMQRMNAVAEGLSNTIGLLLVPAFQPLADAATASLGELSTALKDGLQPGEVGEIVLGFTASLTEGLANLSTEITNALPSVQQGLAELVAGVSVALPELAETIIPAAFGLLQSVLDTVAANAEPIAAMATQLITYLAANLTANVSGLAESCLSIVTGIVDGITANLPELITMAATLIVEFATALVGAIPDLAARLPEIVQAIWDGLAAVDWLTLGTNLIQGLVDGLGSAVSALLSSITTIFGNIWQAILGVFGIASPSTEAQSAAGFILQGLLDGFASAVDAVCETVKKIFGKIWEAIKSIFGFGTQSEESKEAKNAGKDIMTGMQSGITENEGTLDQAVRNVSKNVLWTMMNEMGIANGTSWKTRDYGKHLVAGVRDGLDETKADAFGGAAGKVYDAVIAALGTAFGVQSTGVLGLGGTSATKFKELGGYVRKAIADGIESSEDNREAVANALTAVANAAYQAAMERMAAGISGGETTVNAAVEAACGSALAAAAALMTTDAGSTLGADWIGAAITAIEDAESDIETAARDTAQAGVDAASGRMNAPSGRTIGAAFSGGVATGISQGLPTVRGNAASLGSDALTALWSAIGGSSATRFQAVGDAIADGMVRGIRNGSSRIEAAARAAALAAYNAAREVLGIASPSRVMEEAGRFYATGFALGIENNTRQVVSAAQSLSRAAAEAGTGSSAFVLDYERLGDELADAMQRRGLGTAVIGLDGHAFGTALEPNISQATRRRSAKSMSGRNSRMVFV
ncbi:MAG: hypothetical protein GXY67_10560 [Clostridiales bacterium]|nr:hypothetical protein [Clostridiales bacterium]